MQLRDIRVGLKVQFVTFKGGKRVGLDKEIYTIIDINFNDWESCDILVECDGYTVYTNHEAIEIATDTAIKEWENRYVEHYEQMTIFDFLEVV